MSTNRALQPPLPAALRPYEDVMKLLAAFSGPNCEVVLHDLSDPVHSVVRVENGEVTGRAVGQGLRHLVPNLLRMSRTDDGALSSESPNLLPVYWLRSRGRLIRALSLLIRDDAGEVIGVLCINQDVTNVSAAAGQLQALLALLPPGEASILRRHRHLQTLSRPNTLRRNWRLQSRETQRPKIFKKMQISNWKAAYSKRFTP